VRVKAAYSKINVLALGVRRSLFGFLLTLEIDQSTYAFFEHVAIRGSYVPLSSNPVSSLERLIRPNS
jgi:hypothetical protein